MLPKFGGRHAESHCFVCYEPFIVDIPKLRASKKQNPKGKKIVTVRSSFCSLFNISEDNPTFIDVQRLSNCCLSCQKELIEAENINLQIRKLQKDLDKIRVGLEKKLLGSHRRNQRLTSSVYKAKGYHLNQVTNSIRDEVARRLNLSKINRDLPPPAASEPEVLNESDSEHGVLNGSDSDLDEPDFSAYVPQFGKVEESLLKDCPPGFADPQPHSSNGHSESNNILIEKVEIEDEGIQGQDLNEPQPEVVGDEIEIETDPHESDFYQDLDKSGDEMAQEDSEESYDSESSSSPDDGERSDMDSDWEQSVTMKRKKKVRKTILDMDALAQREINLKNELWNKCLKSRPILVLKPVPYRKRHKPVSVEEDSIQKFIQKDKEKIRKQRLVRMDINAPFMSKVKRLLSFKCPVCKKIYEGLGSFDQMTSHVEKTHSFNYKDYMDKYERPERVLCPYCPKSLKSQEYLKGHIAMKHDENSSDKNILCEICKQLVTRKSYGPHLIRHNTSSVQCEHCNRILRPRALKDHLRLKHGIGDPLFNCEYPDCTRKLLSKKELDRHMKEHDGEGFLCDICAKSFQSKATLRSHMFNGHKKKNKVLVECSYCKKLLGPALIERHIKMFHEKEERYFCDKCGKGFYSEGYMRVHLKAHEKAGHHPCRGCNMTFKLRKNLEKHLERGCK